MKQTLFLLIIALLGGLQTSIQAQPAVSRQEAYMIEMYQLTIQQAKEYLKALSTFRLQESALQKQVMSAAKYKEAHKKLFKRFQASVSKALDQEQFKTWNSCIKDIERYQTLSELKLVPRAQINALYSAESQWFEKRKKMWASAEEESNKHQKNKELLANLENDIIRILGLPVGNWYIEEKRIALYALDNMDKYHAPYIDAYQIARIENQFSQKRKAILEIKGKKRADREEELFANDEAKTAAIKKTISTETAKRWVKFNNAPINYALNKRYELNSSQISQYKDAYNAYMIEEYKILYEQKKLSPATKLAKLTEANEKFCIKVQPLFSTDNYTKWKGRREYEFSRKMKQKKMKTN